MPLLAVIVGAIVVLVAEGYVIGRCIERAATDRALRAMLTKCADREVGR